MSEAAPAVTVIIPAYNGGALIGETLATLWAQHFADFEVVVVDDCSTDDTRERLAGETDPRLHVIHAEANRGVVHTRNRALTHARGRYIAALDQDDLCLPERFARQVAYLDAHPGVALVGAAASLLEGGAVRPSRLPPVTTPALVEYLLMLRNPLVWSSVMMRADAARALDPFTRPDRRYAEDFDLYHRIRALGGVARIDDPLLVYRCHEGQASQRYAEAMEGAAGRVLADAYQPLFGAGAEGRAMLVTRHVMAGEPVPDRATLATLGATIMAVQTDLITRHAPGPESLRLIRWETARIWGAIGRRSLRSGRLGIADVLAIRPDHLGMGYVSPHEAMLSGLVGGARAMRGRGASTQ